MGPFYIKLIFMAHTYESISELTEGFTKSNLFHKVQLTPEMASKIKQSNNRNRPFRKYLAKQYAKDMRNGTFRHNGDSMRFDTNGNMIDGQHRTEAVLLSGCTIEVNIETGLEVEAYDTIDQGLKRSTSDVLFTMDIKDSSVVAAGLGLYMNLIDKTVKGKRKSISPHIITKYLKDNVQLVPMIEDCALRSRKYSRALGSCVSANMFMAILYLARKKHGDTQETYKGKPHGWIQWKGTDVCMDIHCKCGGLSHVDEQFAYHVKCPQCGTVYMCNGHIELIELEEEPTDCVVVGDAD